MEHAALRDGGRRRVCVGFQVGKGVSLGFKMLEGFGGCVFVGLFSWVCESERDEDKERMFFFFSLEEFKSFLGDESDDTAKAGNERTKETTLFVRV